MNTHVQAQSGFSMPSSGLTCEIMYINITKEMYNFGFVQHHLIFFQFLIPKRSLPTNKMLLSLHFTIVTLLSLYTPAFGALSGPSITKRGNPNTYDLSTIGYWTNFAGSTTTRIGFPKQDGVNACDQLPLSNPDRHHYVDAIVHFSLETYSSAGICVINNYVFAEIYIDKAVAAEAASHILQQCCTADPWQVYLLS
jgi:hypothetical protein